MAKTIKEKVKDYVNKKIKKMNFDSKKDKDEFIETCILSFIDSLKDTDYLDLLRRADATSINQASQASVEYLLDCID